MLRTLSKTLFPLRSQSPAIPSLASALNFFRRIHDDDSDKPRRMFVVQPRIRSETALKAKLDEALNLANSLEEQRDGLFGTDFSDKHLPPHIVVQDPIVRGLRADTYFGSGTVDNIKCHLNAVDSTEDGIDAIFVNAILTGIQQRNLERAWGKPVLDRVGLIIEIFHAHAQTKEGKLQAELAALMYKRTRLVRIRSGGRLAFGSAGEAEVVSARGRGSGGRGFISGAGETELQLQRRRIQERRRQLLSEIKEVRRTRALQRSARKRHGSLDGQDMSTIAVVGYTNAGKSTLVSALSDTNLFCDDRLFATVDPKVRSVILPSGKKVLLSDTVGFISDLPVQLVEAFHATLEEVVEADLLVHVLDSSAPNRDEQRDAVLQVLKQIGVSHVKLQNMIEVWNKVDLVKEDTSADNNDEAAQVDLGNENLCLDKNGEEIEEGCSTCVDDENNEFDLLEENVGDSDGDNNVLSELETLEETMSDEDREISDDWRASEVGEVTLEDQDASLMVSESAEDQQKDSSSSQSQLPVVKTSAITRVGLQELLELIDEKLKTERVVGRASFDRKWRPHRAEDAEIAVGG